MDRGIRNLLFHRYAKITSCENHHPSKLQSYTIAGQIVTWFV